MMRMRIIGTNNCYVCGNELNWEKVQGAKLGQAVVIEQPEVTADACAIGINEDGTVKFEITCTCPRCKSKNKFYQNVKVS